MTGAEYIAEFLARMGIQRVYLLTGGACAFMVDAVGRHPDLDYVCFQHEQAAAMAADAVWRVSGRVGVTMATSGPGATNLITGIACSYFDSIPSLHITGQVNQRENENYSHANVRQSGFQETRIVEMVKPVTKSAVKVTSGEHLRQALADGYALASSGRMGPVLIDVPMDIQQIDVGNDILLPVMPVASGAIAETISELSKTFAKAERPLVLWGGGVGLAGVEAEVADWLKTSGLPFVSSWAGLTKFDHDHQGYLGQIGVYGNRGANFALQNADAVLVLGSRLDNRQRTGNPKEFAAGAIVHVLDVDAEELRKFDTDGYKTTRLDFRLLPEVLAGVSCSPLRAHWRDYLKDMRSRYRDPKDPLSNSGDSPYAIIRCLKEALHEDAIVVTEASGTLCWLFQAFRVKRHNLFTSGGHGPMGYALPAAIGAKLESRKSQVVAVCGDGGIQLNVQELQTLVHYELDVAIVVMNNAGYGIIRQFQDANLQGRHEASDKGYSNPSFEGIAAAYGLSYVRIEKADQVTAELFGRGRILIEVIVPPESLVIPKVERGRPINDQFPYLDAVEYASGNRFVDYPRPPGLI